MPKATADTKETYKKDLATLEGGYVVLKKMTYGERLHQRDLAMTFSPSAQEGMRMGMNSEESTAYEFRVCIVDHNLEDENGRPLDFRNKADVVRLDPRIASEIEGYLNEINQPEPMEEGKDGFPTVSSELSKPEAQPTTK